MPNHIHAIIVIQNNTITGRQPSSPTEKFNYNQSLSLFVSGFKSVVTKRINILCGASKKPVWQRSFYDHIIHTIYSLKNIREYVINNPRTWGNDENNITNYSIKGKACLAPTGLL